MRWIGFFTPDRMVKVLKSETFKITMNKNRARQTTWKWAYLCVSYLWKPLLIGCACLAVLRCHNYYCCFCNRNCKYCTKIIFLLCFSWIKVSIAIFYYYVHCQISEIFVYPQILIGQSNTASANIVFAKLLCTSIYFPLKKFSFNSWN